MTRVAEHTVQVADRRAPGPSRAQRTRPAPSFARRGMRAAPRGRPPGRRREPATGKPAGRQLASSTWSRRGWALDGHFVEFRKLVEATLFNLCAFFVGPPLFTR